MQTIQLTGQAITGTNYATDRIFDFNPEPVARAADAFLAGGISEIEVPQGVLDPDKRFPETGIDLERLSQTKAALDDSVTVIGTYLSSFSLGEDNAGYLDTQRRALAHLIEHFPAMQYAVLHPPGRLVGGVTVEPVVETYARLAEYAQTLKDGFTLSFHNHYDTTAETADQVREYLAEIEKVGSPFLTWGPDTAHSHGMGEQMIPVFEEYAHLIGGFFHIKARIPAFDRSHGGAYEEHRDIWSSAAEVGSGLYGGFVNVADPEIQTPLAKLFEIIRTRASSTSGVIRGAIEIDNPRQHPRLEVLCAVLFLKNVLGAKTTLDLTNDEIIAGVFEI